MFWLGIQYELVNNISKHQVVGVSSELRHSNCSSSKNYMYVSPSCNTSYRQTEYPIWYTHIIICFVLLVLYFGQIPLYVFFIDIVLKLCTLYCDDLFKSHNKLFLCWNDLAQCMYGISQIYSLVKPRVFPVIIVWPARKTKAVKSICSMWNVLLNLLLRVWMSTDWSLYKKNISNDIYSYKINCFCNKLALRLCLYDLISCESDLI